MPLSARFVPILDVKPFPSNAKTHPRAQIEAIARSIKEFGWTQPIVVDKDYVIVAGHGRWLAAQFLGLAEVPIVMPDLMPEQVRAYRLADNKLAESKTDKGLVLEELKALDLAGFDITLTGFGLDLVRDVHEDEPPPAPPTDPVAKRGEVWQLGEHRVMCGDATSAEDVVKLMMGGKADMIFTDPPYGVDYSGGIQFTKGGVTKEQRDRLENDDDASIYTTSIPVMASLCDGPIYTWFAGTEALSLYKAISDVGGQVHAMIVWVKNGGYGALNASYKQRHEPCLFWKPKGSSLNFIGDTTESTVWEISKDGRNELHPTQKPIALAFRAIRNHDADIVLDLFGGSGSTLIACEQLNRKCRMMEIDPRYVDVIIARWERATGKKAVKL